MDAGRPTVLLQTLSRFVALMLNRVKAPVLIELQVKSICTFWVYLCPFHLYLSNYLYPSSPPELPYDILDTLRPRCAQCCTDKTQKYSRCPTGLSMNT